MMNKYLLAWLTAVASIAMSYAQSYEESLTIPVYNASNSEMGMITSPANFSSVINTSGKRIFFIQPGDYSSLGTVTIDEDGTSSNPRWLIYYDPNNPTDYTTHPVDMDPSDYVTFGRMNLEGEYWRLDRIRSIGDEPTRNPNISMLNDHIVLNRCLMEMGGGGAGQISVGSNGKGLPSNYGVVQHCVVRNTQISSGDDNHAIKVSLGHYNRIVHNEIYNFAGDGIQFGDGPTEFKGSVVYDNDIYIDPSTYEPGSVSKVPHENGIDIKAAGGSGTGDHVLIAKNRFRNLGKTPGGTSPNADQGAIDHSNSGQQKSYVLIEDNVFYECRVPFNTKGGFLSDHYTIRRNLMYKANRFGIWISKDTEDHHDIYLNTIVEVETEDGDKNWMESRAKDTYIRGNVIINGGGTLSDSPSGSVSDYNAFYNTTGHSFEGSNSISYSSASDAEQTDYTFTIRMFSGPENLVIPNARPTTSSPHYNLTSGITFGNVSGVGYNNSDTYTQSWAGALAPSANGAIPTVSITSPSNGATVDGTITVSATASDTDNDLAGVQFKLDGNNIGSEDTSSPYSVSWNTTGASEGNHVLTAVARDNNGNLGYSSAISVIVDNQTDVAPTVSITSPANSATVSEMVTVTASASDTNGDLVGVQFKLDGANLGAEDTSFPYSVCWNTASEANGSYVLTAVARDAAGLTTTSSSVTVTVDNVPPTCVTIPNTNSWSNSSIIEQTGDFTVEFDVTPDHDKQFRIGFSNGTGSNDDDAAATVRFDNDKIFARDGQGWPSTTIPYTVGETYHIRMVMDMTNDTYDVFANLEGNSPVQIADGNDFRATPASIDNLMGKLYTTSSGYEVEVCNIVFDGEAPASTPPTVALTSPTDGTTVSGTISVTATASDVDSDLTGVQFKLNGANLGSQDTSSPYSYSWNTTSASNGVYTITAVATDGAGNSTTSAARTVTVSNASGGSSPTVSITAPSNSATVSNTVTITATASDPDSDLVGVQFKLDGSNLGSQDTSSPFSYSWNTTGASNGSHTLTAVATDAAGNSTTSSSISVTVSNSGGSCFELPNTNDFVNTSITSQSSNFTLEFDVTPGYSDQFRVGISNGVMDHEDDASGTVRFKSGKIFARDGQGWPSTTIPYSVGETYHIKMVMDMTNETYDVFANKVGDSPSQIASGNDFQAKPSSLDNVGGKLFTTSSGHEIDICNISVNSSSRLATETKVEEIILEMTDLKVFPNPVLDVLKINQSGAVLSGKYTISSISGSSVLRGELSGKDIEIKTADLKSGVYLLSLYLDGETPKTIRIIKR